MQKQENVKCKYPKTSKHIQKYEQYLQEAQKNFMNLWEQDIPRRYGLEDIELIKTVGAGAFGRVVLAREKDTNQQVAIKVLEKRYLVETSQIVHCKNEIKILSCIRFQFIINMNYFFMDNVYLYIGMDYIEGGEMFAHLRMKKKFDENLARFYAAQIVLSFEYLHNVGVIYRDLKPENIMLQKDGYIKLTDCGFCKKIGDGRTYTLCGTPEYLAPEIILRYGYAVDWWALGVLIFEICAGRPPFVDQVPMNLFEKVVSGTYECPSNFSKHLRNLLANLIVVQSTDRFGVLKNGAADIKCHEWYKNFDWAGVLDRKLKPPRILKANNLPVWKRKNMSITEFRKSPENEYGEEFSDFSFLN